MPLGFAGSQPRQVLVPEGHPTIAQRFSVGSAHRKRISPEGTAEPCRAFRPSLRDLFADCAQPNAEALGYSQSSLRDEEIQTLAALDASSACFVAPPINRCQGTRQVQLRADEASALLS